MTVIINAFVRFDFSGCEILDLEKLRMLLSAIAYARSSLTPIPSMSSVNLYRYPLLDMKMLISSCIRYRFRDIASFNPRLCGLSLFALASNSGRRSRFHLPFPPYQTNLSTPRVDHLTYIYLYRCWENSWLF